MTRQRRSFDPGFKLEVVKMIQEQGLSVGHVSESMSIGTSAIRRWVAQYAAEQTGQPARHWQTMAETKPIDVSEIT